MKDTFSIAEGLGYQQDNLNKWKKILIPEVYEHLERYCMDNNSKLDINIHSGRNVKRGVDLDNVIGNYMLGWRFVNGERDYDNNDNK